VSEYKLLWALSCFIAAIITFNGKLFLFAIYLFIASGLVDGFFRLTSWRAIYRALLAAPDFYTQ